MLRKSLLENACGTIYVQKPLLCRQMLRKLFLENAFDTKYVQKHYFEGKCYGNHYLKMHLTPNTYKNITLKANAKEIINCKICLTPHMYKIVTLSQMLRKSLLENAFGTTYVQNHYFEGKCSGNHNLKMHLTLDMCKIMTLKANAQEIIHVKSI